MMPSPPEGVLGHKGECCKCVTEGEALHDLVILDVAVITFLNYTHSASDGGLLNGLMQLIIVYACVFTPTSA